MELLDRVALVVGGSSGIGLGTARALADAGCRVMVAGRNETRAREAAAGIGGAVAHGHCDATSAASIDRLFGRALELWGRIDIVVTSVGLRRSPHSKSQMPDPIMSLPEAVWDDMLGAYLKSVYLVSRAAGRIMAAQGSGQIVNVSSSRGSREGHAFSEGYCAAKHGVNVLGEALSEELAPAGVRVITVLPDMVDTPLIAGTNLGQEGMLEPRRVGEWIVEMLRQPMDVMLEEPMLYPEAPGGNAG